MKLFKVGRHPMNLPKTSSNKLLLIYSDKFPMPGSIVRWDYYRSEPNVPVFACVWRKIGDHQYKLIDYNELMPGVIDFQACDIDEEEQILVQSGDFIGVFYSKYSVSGAVASATENQVLPSEQISRLAGGTEPSEDKGTEVLTKDGLSDVIEVALHEEDLSPDDIIDLSEVPNTSCSMAVALQANIKISEKK